MKLFPLVVPAFVLALSAFAAEPAIPAAPESPADHDYAALRDAASEPQPPASAGKEAFLFWFDRHLQQIGEAGINFYEKHPEDPRRWDAVLGAVVNFPYFATGFGPDVGAKGFDAAIVDEAKRAAWDARVAPLRRAVIESPEVTPRQREAAEWSGFARDFRQASALAKAGGAPDWAAFGPRFAAHLAKYPEPRSVMANVRDFIGALETQAPAVALVEWRRLLDSPNSELRDMAARKVGLAEARERLAATTAKPFELAFTAVDGRAVDLAKLRGKVVLVDFWATWCMPCREELPNVKSVYASYHDEGFEIVGITLENAKFTAKDTPGQHAAKTGVAKQVLVDFLAKEQVPWPQYFDGTHWKNDVAIRFAVVAIPAAFLLDRDGRLVTTDLRGPKLEAAVKRLLNR